MELTKENYKDAHEFFSYSRVSAFTRCEAKVAAGFHEPSSVSQLVGSYVDAYFSQELDGFIAEHPEIYNSRTGALKSDFTKADDLIKRIESDDEFMHYMSGEKQAIMTGTIDGIPFKIKMDSYMPDKFIVDLKVLKDFNKVWSDAFNSYTSFIYAYDYDIEMALFQEIVYQNTGKKLPCILACITKEDPSDVGLFQIGQEALDKALNQLKSFLPRMKKVLIDKTEKPHRCEKCMYCRQTKKSRLLDFELVGLGGDQLRENGIECDDPIAEKEEK